jgi:hypothetical protein
MWHHSALQATKTQLEEFFQSAGHSRFLFRGIQRFSHFSFGLSRPPSPSYFGDGHDFGDGIYFTPSFELARRYAHVGGVISVHDWSQGPGSLSETTVDIEQWMKYVKFNLALGNPDLPTMSDVPEYNEDFLTGPIPEETQSVYKCRPPRPTSEQQTVAKTPNAFNLMANRLVAVIYFD